MVLISIPIQTYFTKNEKNTGREALASMVTRYWCEKYIGFQT